MQLACDYIYKHKGAFDCLYHANAFADLGYPFVVRQEPAVVAEGRTEVAIDPPHDTWLADLFDPFDDQFFNF
jgi:hypothetical protein